MGAAGLSLSDIRGNMASWTTFWVLTQRLGPLQNEFQNTLEQGV